ncbi:hypothetical protein [Nonomuraea salmonea]|uniref:hypothetical protein n=1 Tax=Nonomuraea salmonea TaxID=46181 RepID=UPI002FE8060A
MTAFADRATAELRAAGEDVRGRTTGDTDDLTAQETHIARLVAGGATSKEVAGRLFISPPHRRRPPAQHLPQARHHLPPSAEGTAHAAVTRWRSKAPSEREEFFGSSRLDASAHVVTRRTSPAARSSFLVRSAW